jgi:hypothetical protein
MDEPVRYEKGGMPSPRSLFEAMRRGATKSSPSPWFRNPDAAKGQERQNAVDDAVSQVVAQQQMQQAMNAHVMKYLNNRAQTAPGRTLSEGRNYPMRTNGQHSAETNAQLQGECSDAGRRLNECKGDGRTGSGKY